MKHLFKQGPFNAIDWVDTGICVFCQSTLWQADIDEDCDSFPERFESACAALYEHDNARGIGPHLWPDATEDRKAFYRGSLQHALEAFFS